MWASSAKLFELGFKFYSFVNLAWKSSKPALWKSKLHISINFVTEIPTKIENKISCKKYVSKPPHEINVICYLFSHLHADVRKAFASSLGRKHSFAAGNGEDLHEIRSSILEIKNELDKHDAAMSQIMEDMNKKQLHLEALYGHVGQLENVKADKQQIDCEIQIKADRKDLENKVSQDKFHNSLSTLDQSVQDLVEKLVGHVSGFWCKLTMDHLNTYLLILHDS